MLNIIEKSIFMITHNFSIKKYYSNTIIFKLILKLNSTVQKQYCVNLIKFIYLSYKLSTVLLDISIRHTPSNTV